MFACYDHISKHCKRIGIFILTDMHEYVCVYTCMSICRLFRKRPNYFGKPLSYNLPD